MKSPRFDSAHILTVGDAMLDRYWHGDTRRVSAEAPIPVIDVTAIEDRPGGAANVALNVASLGARSALVAATGRDEAAEVLLQKLEASGIDCRFIQFDDWPTITKIRLVSRNQQMLRADFERGHLVPVEQMMTAVGAVEGYDSIIVSDYDKGMFSDLAPLMSHARQLGKPVLVDPKFKPFADYAGATLIKPNTLELQKAVGQWSSEADMIARCRELMTRTGCEAFLVTRAAEGMTLIYRDEEEAHFPARTREVYDTSGAGDTVIAVLAAALASGQTLKDAVALSNIAAGIVVSHFGVTSVSGPELRKEVNPGESTDRGKMSAEQLAIAVQVARTRGERIVFTNGCFDILHAGHVDYLNDARQEGDKLIVAVNSDASVRRLKGEGRPINTLERRMTMLAGLSSVDWVVSFDEDTPENLLRQIKPDVLVKGGDYSVDQVVGGDIVTRAGGEVKVLSLVEDCSTTAIVEKIRKL
ncbi:MAG: bifunctional D-glycero-beta-D-manno-heptose-7-phosphate kinase/D-glycero-beta-D-manno-heptose 1-phosphate adenylyltransferase HldE [Proteobacteria bacterium]|nr:bifunctional D-glycero-beta-D-manno-heptose-7-phosphate kinase/D-glycero-beta-D-manno-heptose 1-phosphate adenylyltransferase HldE [Pseudomonadota bacterium]